MSRARLFAAVLAVAALPFASGCITLFSKTEVVRSEETPVRPQFENTQAEDAFRTAVRHKSRSVGGTHVGVPFVTLYERDRQLAPTAHFNACVVRCDTNQDGFITVAEAKGFEKMQD